MTTSTTNPSLKERWAWAFYDWANSAFVTTVIVAFFPIFFRSYWANQLPSEEVTLHLGTANSLASLAVMLLAPFLGAVADRGGIKKPLMAVFVALGVCATLLLTIIGEGHWQFAMFAF
ncbi:MAG TPA: MFS transporter, partial [Thiolinea sp.]|nr:MFS transporter [Thiolinea sp.]